MADLGDLLVFGHSVDNSSSNDISVTERIRLTHKKPFQLAGATFVPRQTIMRPPPPPPPPSHSSSSASSSSSSSFSSLFSRSAVPPPPPSPLFPTAALSSFHTLELTCMTTISTQGKQIELSANSLAYAHEKKKEELAKLEASMSSSSSSSSPQTRDEWESMVALIAHYKEGIEDFQRTQSARVKYKTKRIMSRFVLKPNHLTQVFDNGEEEEKEEEVTAKLKEKKQNKKKRKWHHTTSAAAAGSEREEEEEEEEGDENDKMGRDAEEEEEEERVELVTLPKQKKNNGGRDGSGSGCANDNEGEEEEEEEEDEKEKEEKHADADTEEEEEEAKAPPKKKAKVAKNKKHHHNHHQKEEEEGEEGEQEKERERKKKKNDDDGKNWRLERKFPKMTLLWRVPTSLPTAHFKHDHTLPIQKKSAVLDFSCQSKFYFTYSCVRNKEEPYSKPGNTIVMFGCYSPFAPANASGIPQNLKNLRQDWLCPSVRGHSVSAVGDCLYIIGGVSAEGVLLLGTWRFNTVRKTWRTCAPMPIGQVNHEAVGMGKKIYVFGGVHPSSPIAVPVMVYDTLLDAWTSLASAECGGLFTEQDRENNIRLKATCFQTNKIVVLVSNRLYVFDVLVGNWVGPPPGFYTTSKFKRANSSIMWFPSKPNHVLLFGGDVEEEAEECAWWNMETRRIDEQHVLSSYPRSNFPPALALLGASLFAIGGDPLISAEHFNGRDWKVSSNSLFLHSNSTATFLIPTSFASATV